MESMKDYEKELERSFRTINEGDIVSGAVVAVTDEEVTLDLNYYAPGIIKIENLSNDPDFHAKEELQPGDIIEATVVRTDDGHGNIELSKKEANEVLAWDKLREMMEQQTVVTVRIKESVPSGVVAFLEGIRAFIPASQLSAESGLTCADEMLYPENWGYVEDLLSYVAIGARSVEDQQHRLTVSGFDVASGMKNPTSGDFSVMLNSVYAAQHPHHFVYRGYEVETTGNPLTHVVLRGAVSKHGNTTQNYHYEDLIRLHEMYEKMDVIHPAAIIDTNHSNSGKKFKEQIRIAKEVMHNRQLSSDIRSLVKGLMIESYIEEGNQSIGDHIYGKSITDPCLGWEDSKQLIYDIAEMNAK